MLLFQMPSCQMSICQMPLFQMHYALCKMPNAIMQNAQISNSICPMSLYQIPLCPPLMPNVNIPNVIHHANMASFMLSNVILPTVILLHVTRLHVVAPIASYDESRSSGIDKNVASVVFSQNRPWQRLGGLCQG
jgi:hypothetical protein